MKKCTFSSNINHKKKITWRLWLDLKMQLLIDLLDLELKNCKI